MTQPSRGEAEILISEALPPGSADPVDVRIAEGSIAQIQPAGSIRASAAAEVVHADGRTLLPGLWDHHVHFTQWVMQQQRLDLTGATTAEQALELVAEAAAGTPEGRQLIGFGFRDGLWPQPPSLQALDAAAGTVPAVLVSADLHCVWVSSAAQQQFGVVSDSTGLLRETEAFAVLEKLDSASDLTPADYRRAAEAAAARGVVGIIEFENDENTRLWPERVAAGVDQLRVEVSAWPDKLDAVIAAGLSTGDVLDEGGLITMGPLKVIVDGSLNTRTAWCWDPYPGLPEGHHHRCGMEAVPIEQLAGLMTAARDAGIGAAIHAIGDRANTEVLNTFEALGMTGAVEHAQLLRTEDVARFARLGLIASVQPEHAMDDRDVADLYWSGRTDRAFMLRSLLDAGAQLRMGSDAPVSPLDPWIQIAAAVTRSRDGRSPWHPEQRITVDEALAASTRSPLRLSPGHRADLVLTEADPLRTDPEQLRGMQVAATMVGGRFTHRRL
ncbi:amidohydrolase family protein [Nesterenkonia sp.]|uniref:amidohydrolase n=1 Tax=Nesterenkonia sp. TaxID=704201 RepID=UPI002614A6B3|nr:amidohydrolase family protein [Nesterenkonia sp.]